MDTITVYGAYTELHTIMNCPNRISMNTKICGFKLVFDTTIIRILAMRTKNCEFVRTLASLKYAPLSAFLLTLCN
jgi:hypothetical protein